MSNKPSRAARSAAVRDHLVAALAADLIGPYAADLADELLPRPPSRWYLTGFLAPEARRVALVNEDEEAAVEDVEGEEELSAGADDATTDAEEKKPKRRMLWPASIGLSVLVPAAVKEIRVTVTWADYHPETEGSDGAVVPAKASPTKPPAPSRHPWWRRAAQGPVKLALSLERPTGKAKVPGSNGLELQYEKAAASGPALPSGAQALSLFLVNRRIPVEGPEADTAMVFQVSLALEVAGNAAGVLGLIARPNHRGERSEDEDERTADLQYRDKCEWAVGHGIATEPVTDVVGTVIGASTVWLPRAIVPMVKTMEDIGPDVTLGMDAIADLDGGAATRSGLIGLAQRYRDWIDGEKAKADQLKDRRRSIALQLVEKAKRAHGRIVEGIELLSRDAEIRTAFQLANRAMAAQARQRNAERAGYVPSWRPFQLAFLLLSLPGIGDDTHDDREIVELIYFPTGGGKTEAYLGLAATVLVLRRLRGSARLDRGLGVAVLLRYTLRLLTLDQLGRAATLICALERLRQEDPTRLGPVRFSLGLWVGEKATPNTVKRMEEKLEEYRDRADDAIPCPLTSCPWCGTALTKGSIEVRIKGVPFPEVRLGCVSTTGTCPFTLAAGEGLPVIFVDEQLYRELPGFVIGTVDKLAMLPFRGETAALFGKVVARDGRVFLGLMDSASDAARGEALPHGLRPPDLIIQDELHLISGPLGTMVGLYEMAVDGLCARTGPDGRRVRPKIVTSTATVRRARQQIAALFARTPAPAMFPPAGIDAADSFFGKEEAGGFGRLYLGVAAPGRSSKAVLLRIYVALLTAAERSYQQGPETPDAREAADAYKTLIGYFNSLRELGGMRRLVEDEVRVRCEKHRPPENYVGPSRWFARRTLGQEPLELTSRESTQKITEAKRQLERPFAEAVDVALASNMISVGVDVPRLGLMVVAGQPKTTSEYIQATSRIGRDRDKPGLVVVAFNVHRPRDRSHFEHFGTYHEAIYGNVEATSVTPFSAPALERGLAGALVALTRLGDAAMVPALAAGALKDHLAHRDAVLEMISERASTAGAIDAPPGEAEEIAEKVRNFARALFDSWDRIVAGVKHGEQARVYSTFDEGYRKRSSLLVTRLDETGRQLNSDEARFVAPTSMRDVESPVHLWVSRRNLGRAEERNGTAEK